MTAHQVHGNLITVVTNIDQDTELPSCDGMVTAEPGVGLLILQADCQAILLQDPVQSVIACIHSGWRGSCKNIIGSAISRMRHHFGCKPANLLAAISPSLGPCCGEFLHYQWEIPPHLHHFQVRPGYFDFWEISRQQLLAAGIPASHIDISRICTRCDRRFFSYRRARSRGLTDTGRNGSVIVLPMS